MALSHGAPASISVATAPRPATNLIWRPGQQIHHGAPCQRLLQGASASNKPHPAEKSTPVWLAIWLIWAEFADSQLLPDAAPLSSMQGLSRSGNSSAQTSASLHPPAALRLRVLPFTRGMVAHGLCGRVPDSAGNACSVNCCCSDIANLSAHLHRLPTPPPHLRRMRLSPGRVAQVLGAGGCCRLAGDAGVECRIRLTHGLVRRSSKSPSTRILF